MGRENPARNAAPCYSLSMARINSTRTPRPAAKTSGNQDPAITALRQASRGPRLHKAIANAGVASRRDCETMIAQRRVTVNGIKIDFQPCFVDPARDHIEVDGQPIQRAKTNSRGQLARGHTYVMVNKPRGVICTNDDPEGRKKIVDMVPHPNRLFCVGRLDAESTGLVMLTDDGELANKLTHPRYGVHKTYMVTINRPLLADDVEKLQDGMYLADKEGETAKVKAAQIKVVSREAQKTKMLIRLREGRNREIRRMLARLGYRVHRLQRVGLGPLLLKGVGLGQWRPLRRDEVAVLRKVAAGKMIERNPHGAAPNKSFENAEPRRDSKPGDERHRGAPPKSRRHAGRPN